MSLINGSAGGLGGAGAPGGALAGGAVYSHTLNQSLRFDAAGYLTRNTGEAGNTTVYTTSFWVKRSGLTSNQYIFSAGPWNGGNNFEGIRFVNDDTLRAILTVSNSTVANFTTNAKFRDVSAWYHIVWQRNGQEYKIYVNGTKQTYSTSTFSSNPNGYLTADTEQLISGRLDHLQDLDGYLAEFNFVDGSALDPTSFGETSGGVWVPKAYSGSYGTTGFHLTFSDNTSIGADSSGLSHNFTVSGLVASDVVPDSPTNNWSTLNSLKVNTQTQTFAEGNLDFSSTQTSTNPAVTSTFVVPSGKWYWEVYIRVGAASNSIGIAKHPNVLENDVYALYVDDDAYQYMNDGTTRNGSSTASYGNSWTTGDIVGVALDLDAGAVYFYKNGTIQNSGTAAFTSLSGEFSSYGLAYQNGAHVYNFGQDDSFAGNKTSGSANASDGSGLGQFYYSVPSGYKSLCASNLPDITIGPGQDQQADDNFNTLLYSGSDFTSLHIGAGGARRPADTISIANSLQFSDSSLHRDITSSGNTRTWTWSAWVKRSSLGGGSGQYLFHDGAASGFTALNFDSSDRLYAQVRDTTGSISRYKLTNRTFKSLSTWYHIVWRVDTTQSTDVDRSRLYINGTQITGSDWDTEQNVATANNETSINASGTDHLLGAYKTSATSRHFDGYMAEVILADGQSYGPETFGQVGANGDWIPKTISGITYGQNGFRLTFQTSAYPGYDYQTSDRSTTNDFDTTDNVASSDILIDSPTQNFSTLDSQRYSNLGTFSKGGLTITTSTNQRAAYGTIAVPSSGKWYYEVRVDNYVSASGSYFGWGTDVNLGDNENGLTKAIAFSNYNEQVLLNGAGQSGGYGVTSNDIGSNGDVYSILLDVDNGLFYYAKNGTYFNSANPSNGTGGLAVSDTLAAAVTAVHPMIARGGSSNETYTFNFGQDPSFHNQETAPGTDKTDANGVGKFLYDVPTGFLALMDDNIPQEGVISPDFVWIKKRSGNASHYLFDTVRGAGKDLHSDATSAEVSSVETLKSFDSQGFTVGLTTDINDKDATYAAWTWKAGGPAPTQTYTVKVVADGGNKYRFDDNTTNALTLNLQEGGTYTFDLSDSSVDGHPMKFSTTSNGSHGGGSTYSTGVVYKLDGVSVTEANYYNTTNFNAATTRQVVITVAHNAPTLYYFCHYHSGMGGQANTTATRGSSNFKGSIPSVVSANTAAGFSIVSVDTDGNTSGTVGHGLASTPQLIIGKTRNHAVGWYVQTPLTAANLVGAFDDAVWYDPGYNHYNDTHPTDSVFSVGGYMADHADLTNPSTKIVYCFANVEGYSKIGTYTGGGSNLPFVFTGFRPAFVLIRVLTTANAWFLYDNKREGFNESNDTLSPNYNTVEDSTYKLDLLSNGFKIRSTQQAHNESGQTFLYYAIAEAPFKFANAR